MSTGKRIALACISVVSVAATSAAIAGKPGGGASPPPAADIAYLSWDNPSRPLVRGLTVDSNGHVTSDSELWRVARRNYSSTEWNPAGTWLAWFQESSVRNTPAIAIATPGQAPINLNVFSLGELWTASGGNTDALAWGRGCNGRDVLYFWASQGSATRSPTLWVLDPFSAGSQPRLLYERVAEPPEFDSVHGHGSVWGLAASPLGQFLALGEYSATLGQRGIVLLPLTCPLSSDLPVVAGPAQPLFAARYDTDEGWTASLDWSRDGRRLAVAMGRFVPNAGGALVYDADVWVADLNYFAASDTEQVTFESLQHVVTEAASNPSWAPALVSASCDRMAYLRDSNILLLDVPRRGVPPSDCAIPSPVDVNAGAASIQGLDWK